MKKENKKRKISIIITSVALVILLGISFTYAYFSSKKVSTKNSVVAGTLVINYEDDNLNTLSLNNIVPIYDNEIKTKANKIGFKVNNTGGSKAYVDISLTDIVMDSELANLEFKWALYSENTKISNGNFRNVSDNKQLLMNNIEIASNSNKSYQLYIWISESGMDQSNLMGKNFSTKITVNGSQEKGKELLSKVIKDNNSPIVTTTPNFANTATTDEGLIQGVDKDGETYYFRGAVEDNYVMIDGLKWESDYARYIVNGNGKFNVFNTKSVAVNQCNNKYSQYGYDNSETCISKIYSEGHSSGDDMLFRIVRINGDNTIRLISDGSVGKSTFSPSGWTNEYLTGYTMKRFIKYVLDENDKAIFTKKVNLSDTFSYSDEVTTRDWQGGHDLVNPKQYTIGECLNDKSLCEGKYARFSSGLSLNKINKIIDENTIEYYSYRGKGTPVFDENTTVNSKAKTYLDNWYNNTLISYDELLANSRYCNDTTYKIGSGSGVSYGASNRINNSPSFICPNTQISYGGEYDLKVGLITADEANFAGASNNQNIKYYLFGKSTTFWTMSPASFGGFAFEYNINNIGDIASINVHSVAIELSMRPVINLRSDYKYISGDGSKTNPYLIKLQS